MDNPDYWRTIKDRWTGEEVVLTDDQIDLIQRLQKSCYPEQSVDPYEVWGVVLSTFFCWLPASLGHSPMWITSLARSNSCRCHLSPSQNPVSFLQSGSTGRSSSWCMLFVWAGSNHVPKLRQDLPSISSGKREGQRRASQSIGCTSLLLVWHCQAMLSRIIHLQNTCPRSKK